MTRFIILFLLSVDLTISFGQNSHVVLDKFTFQGHSFNMTRDDVIKAFGQPWIIYPKYDCGFFSDEWTGKTNYQLCYSDFNYIGNDQVEFVLEKVEFDKDGKVILKYGDKRLSGHTSMTDLAQIFGENTKEGFDTNQNEDTIILFTKKDDGVRFHFRDGRLTKFEYWTPC